MSRLWHGFRVPSSGFVLGRADSPRAPLSPNRVAALTTSRGAPRCAPTLPYVGVSGVISSRQQMLLEDLATEAGLSHTGACCSA